MPNTKGKTTLDDLLQLKRSEKPSSDYWAQFDKELRIKQRRLLQDQPVDEAILESAFWRNAKRLLAYACAGASCAAVALFSIHTMQTASVDSDNGIELANAPKELGKASPVFIADTASQVKHQPNEIVAAQESPVFVEVPAKEVVTAPSPVLVAQIEKGIKPNFAVDDVALKISSPAFENFDVEQVVSFQETVASQDPVMERYASVGRQSRYAEASINSSNPIDRLTAMALDAELLQGSSRWGLKLDQLTVRF